MIAIAVRCFILAAAAFFQINGTQGNAEDGDEEREAIETGRGWSAVITWFDG